MEKGRGRDREKREKEWGLISACDKEGMEEKETK